MSEESEMRFDFEMGEYDGSEEINPNIVRQQYEFEVESETVFKRLAEDIYKSPKAGIREPITNSSTAIIRAVEEGYLDSVTDGIINIEFETDENKLIIEDNGVGMTRDEIDRILSVIGRSTSRSDAELTGKFGMGFLSIWMLVGGVNGGFIMQTNPRGVDEEPIEGVWNSKGFFELDEKMNNNITNGTRLEILLGQNINKTQISEWVDEYATWARVPIMFKQREDNSSTIDEEYPVQNLIDDYKNMENTSEIDYDGRFDYDDNLAYEIIDNEYFTAINSNVRVSESKNVFSREKPITNYLLLDVPIDSSTQDARHLDYPRESLEIRLNQERRVVVSGPNEGHYVINESENIDGEKTITENDLCPEDVILPQPTGTRDTLADEHGFFNWLGDQFYEQYFEQNGQILHDISTLDEYYMAEDHERNKFKTLINEYRNYLSHSNKSHHRISIDEVGADIGTYYTDKFGRMLELSGPQSNVSYAPKGKKGVSKSENRVRKDIESIVLKQKEDDVDVFMAHRITQERADFVWDSKDEHMIVRIASDSSQKYQDIFGWKYLNELDFETDLEFEDGVREKHLDDSMENTTINIHTHNYGNTEKYNVTDIVNDIDEYNFDVLVLFSRSGYNITDYRDLVTNDVGITSVKDEVYNYISDNCDSDKLRFAEDIIEDSFTVTSSSGEEIELANDDIPNNYYVHLIPKEVTETFRDPDIMSKIESSLRNAEFIDNNDAVYLPITFEERDLSRKTIKSWDKNVIRTDEENSYRSIERFRTLTEFYAGMVLNEDEKCVNALRNTEASWLDGGKELAMLVEENLET